MKTKRVLGLASVLVVGALFSFAATACSGGSSAASDDATATAAPTESVVPTATTPASDTPTSTPAPTLAPTETASLDDLVAQGKELFEKTAGGTGCALCHGMDAKGDQVIGAPNNRGADEQLIWDALGRVQNMAYIKLSNDEVKAIAAYLAFLATQP